MIPVDFSIDLIHPDRVRESEGALDKIFVRLVYDLLKAEHPTLCYPNGGGKDGAIDLWSDVGTERHVFECKQIGVGRKQPPWKAAQSEWCKVRDNLQKNLQQGMEGCHSPYRPWFSNCPCVVRYTYIVSCSIAPPLDRMDELRQEIKGVFEALSTTSETLCHLRNIVVEVVDWDALRRRLEVQPQVIFKWFKDYMPVGLRQLTQGSQLSGFRRYKQDPPSLTTAFERI